MGRFEALAAAQASSRIAFHKKVASPATSGSANTPAVGAEERSPEAVETAPPAEKTSVVDEKQVNPIESGPAASDEILERSPQGVAAPAPVDEAPTEEILAVDSHAVPETSATSPAPPAVPAKEEAVAQVAVPEVAAPVSAVARGAIANLKKCAACGFPVSEGRQLCLDCEKKKVQVPAAAAKPTPRDEVSTNQAVEVSKASAPQEQTAEMPRFLSGDQEEASWLSKHKLMVLAMALAVVVIVVLMMLR
jgi:hypothetical protein